jgi:hypothetical protein
LDLKYFDVEADLKPQWETQNDEQFQSQIKLGLQIEKEKDEKGRSQ